MRQASQYRDPFLGSGANKDDPPRSRSVTRSRLHYLRVPREGNDQYPRGYCAQTLGHILGPGDVRVVRSDGLGNPRAAVRYRIIEWAIGVPAHNWAPESRTEMVDRAWVEHRTLHDKHQVGAPLLRECVGPPTELAAKPKADRRLPDGRSSKPGRMPRTQSDRRDCAAGAAECVDQGVAQPGFGRNPHDDDPGHACHRSSTAVTAFSTP